MTTPNDKITVLVVDDHPIALAGVRKILEWAPDIVIVGETQDAAQVQQLVAGLRPRILLLDLKMPGLRPAELEKWVREHYPETDTLVLTAHDRDSYLAGMMEAGVKGFLSKEESEHKLISAIRRTAAGASLFDDEQIARVKRWKEGVFDKWESLTEQERRVLKLMGEGLDNQAISEQMAVSEKTVEYHTTNLFAKLGVKNRHQAALWMVNFSKERIENIGETE